MFFFYKSYHNGLEIHTKLACIPQKPLFTARNLILTFNILPPPGKNFSVASGIFFKLCARAIMTSKVEYWMLDAGALEPVQNCVCTFFRWTKNWV